MRIAFVSYTFAEYSVRQVNEMASSVDVLLVMPRDTLKNSPVAVDARVQCVEFDQPRLREPLRQLWSIRRLVNEITQFRPDVVHYSHGHLWFNAALPLLRKFPLVVTVHDAAHHPGDAESGKTPQAVMNFGYRRADRLIVHSEHVRQNICNRLCLPESRIDLIPHVAIGNLDSAPTPCRSTQKNVLFYGRIWEYKGLEYLIRAQRRITAAVPDARIVIAGHGEDFDRYRNLMSDPSRFDVRNRWISDEEQDELFRTAAVVALPYIEASQSGVVPVAYSFERPVIVTNVGGLPETVEHGQTGLIVPPRDVNALADAIIELLTDSNRCQAMGQAARQKLLNEYSPAAVTRQTIETYRRAIEQRAPLPTERMKELSTCQ